MTEYVEDIVMCDNCTYKKYYEITNGRGSSYCAKHNFDNFETTEFCQDYAFEAEDEE